MDTTRPERVDDTTPNIRFLDDQGIRLIYHPESPDEPVGKDDVIVRALYRGMIDSDYPTAPMLHFIDEGEHLMHQDDLGSAADEIAIFRMMHALADMPVDHISKCDRQIIWRHVFNSSWIYLYDAHSSVERGVKAAIEKDPDFKSNMTIALGESLGALKDEFAELTGNNNAYDIDSILEMQDTADNAYWYFVEKLEESNRGTESLLYHMFSLRAISKSLF